MSQWYYPIKHFLDPQFKPVSYYCDVNLNTKKGFCYNDRFLYACFNGDKQLINQYIQKKGIKDWDTGLYYACCGGQKDIVSLMIDKGAKDITESLEAAINMDNMNIVKILLESNILNNDELYEGFCQSCEKGNIEIIDLFLTKGISDVFECIEIMIKKRHYDAVKFLIERSGKELLVLNNLNAKHTFSIICKYGLTDIAQLFFDIGIFLDSNILEESLYYACKYGHKKVVDFLINKGVNDLNRGLITASKSYKKYQENKIYKDIVLLLIIKKADILKCVDILDKYDIEYLIKNNITEFKQFTPLAIEIKHTLNYLQNRLISKLYHVLADICIKY